MEHLGCVLESDFVDFYDNELGSTSYSHTVTLLRKKKSRLPIHEQIAYLDQAGIGSLSLCRVREQLDGLQSFGDLLSNNTEFQALMQMVIFEPDGTPSLCSYLAAQQLDPSRWSMNFLPAAPQGSHVITYVQAGTLSVWVSRASSTDWRAGHGESQLSIIASCKHLAAKHLRQLPHPVFSIDFVKVGGEMFAINYDIAPTLSKLGVDQVFSAKEVANAIIDRLDNASSPEPDDIVELELLPSA